ncbi:hypothetical protein GBAR_LOCUS29734 [Geodia barretti]|uniref:Uncharacterized protein n=1 Tax=Geodia barretti TaxID=519541 RepID=A0AA35XJ82_GEOBA|nr:hypothetical protein GBAR_LOCUS29734 [Geodia barretti]
MAGSIGDDVPPPFLTPVSEMHDRRRVPLAFPTAGTSLICRQGSCLMTMMMNCSNSRNLPSEELSDDYDDELEQFKKICFAAPAVNRKRIAVSLDMNDLMAKMKLTLHHHYIILVQKNSDTHNVSNCFES